MKKILLSISLVLLGVLILLPSVSFANGSYTEWTDATKLPTSKGSYKLTCDVTVTSTMTVGAWSGSNITVTLDLNGHTVKFNGGSAYYYVQNTGTLIIEDSIGTGLMTNAGSSYNPYIIYVKGNCEINGGTIENILSSGKAVYVNNGDGKKATCTLNNGTIKNSYDKGGRAVDVGNNATFIMNSGKIENKATGTNGTVPAIDGTQKTGKIIIAGGAIESAGTGIKAALPIVEITGGTIEADWYGLETRYASINPAEGKEINISAGEAILNPYSAPSSGEGNQIIGGNFEAPVLAKDNGNEDNVEVYGGTYTNNNAPMDLTKYLDGATADVNGKVTCSHAETYEEGVAQATCTSEGRTADIICSNCKKTIKKGIIIPMEEHTYGELEIEKEATCTSEGKTADRICSKCKEVIIEGTTIPMKEHIYGEWKIEKEATCLEKGLRYKECVCGDKKTEEINTKGHNYENGKCIGCGENDPDVEVKVDSGVEDKADLDIEDKKDETPKTGSVDVVLLVSAMIAVIAVAGIVIVKQ